MQVISTLGAKQQNMTENEARILISKVTDLFRIVLIEAGHDSRQITRLTTKFRDAGRRSAPWKPTSSRVPGRPQDGADGNRILRWHLPQEHKFHASEFDATLVEVKYYFQALSMLNAPTINYGEISTNFQWLIEHNIAPGEYVDPIQQINIDLNEVVNDARTIQSGHFIPLDRGGRHIPDNAFLMLARSNQLQGNLTLDELLALMEEIVAKHKAKRGL